MSEHARSDAQPADAGERSVAAESPAGIAPRIAGLVVMIDGLLALATAGLLLLISVFPPVAAIEGRPPTEQSWLLQALIALALGVAGIWSGQRALRGIRGGRLVGAAVAALIAVVFAWSVAGASPETMLVWGGLAAVHAVVALVLLAWRARSDEGAGSVAAGAGDSRA